MILKIDFDNHFFAIHKQLFTVFGVVVMLLVFGFSMGSIIICSVYFSIDIIPCLYFHILYWMSNKNYAIEISEDNILIRDGALRKEITRAHVSKLYIYKGASIDPGGMPFFSWESYFYVRILLKSGESIRLTCLFSPKIDHIVTEHLPGVPFERKKRGFNAFFLERFWDECD